jgi:hypothetical protein
VVQGSDGGNDDDQHGDDRSPITARELEEARRTMHATTLHDYDDYDNFLEFGVYLPR